MIGLSSPTRKTRGQHQNVLEKKSTLNKKRSFSAQQRLAVAQERIFFKVKQAGGVPEVRETENSRLAFARE